MSDSQQERNNIASERDDLGMFGRHEFFKLQASENIVWPLPIPHTGADPPTPSTTTAQIEPPSIIELDNLQEFLKSVGSPQIQHAAARRRKKNGIYQCPFHGAGCRATFTARHNLRYHVNAHLGLKPYKCSKCSYAAASPATKKRHQATCKGISTERSDIVPKADYRSSQELADIKLTDQFHLSFGENEISHPDNIWPFHIPTNRAAGLPRLPPIATLSPQSPMGPSPVRPPVINIEAVDDAVLAAELSRIQQTADQGWKQDGIQVNV